MRYVHNKFSMCGVYVLSLAGQKRDTHTPVFVHYQNQVTRLQYVKCVHSTGQYKIVRLIIFTKRSTTLHKWSCCKQPQLPRRTGYSVPK